MAERTWSVYLSGEIHTDWRERIRDDTQRAQAIIGSRVADRQALQRIRDAGHKRRAIRDAILGTVRGTVLLRRFAFGRGLLWSALGHGETVAVHTYRGDGNAASVTRSGGGTAPLRA